MNIQILYWQAVLIQGFFTVISLFAAIILWKMLPKSNFASYDGQHWKLGGAFAGFVLTWGLLHYFSQDTLAEMTPDTGIVSEILNPPINKVKYGKLFQGFDRDSNFYAYNAPFEVEKDRQVWDDALAAHSDRYVERRVHGKYLFYEPVSFRNAVTFFRELRKKIGAVVFDRHIEIRYYENAPILPCNSFFMMKKEGKDRLVFYPHPNIRGQVPSMVLRVTGAENLNAYYRTFFELSWRKAKPINNWVESK